MTLLDLFKLNADWAYDTPFTVKYIDGSEYATKSISNWPKPILDSKVIIFSGTNNSVTLNIKRINKDTWEEVN